jgi:hypothetical protein
MGEAQTFKTADGYTLHLTEDGTWTDGDMTFDSGPDGLPVSEDGEAIEGELA